VQHATLDLGLKLPSTLALSFRKMRTLTICFPKFDRRERAAEYPSPREALLAFKQEGSDWQHFAAALPCLTQLRCLKLEGVQFIPGMSRKDVDGDKDFSVNNFY